jgi:dTDP-4-dehydrorhamnose reductase
LKILLLGRNGQVGRALSPLLPQLGELTALGRDEADFDDPGSFAHLVRSEEPDLIVNAAAYTAVDAAEDDRDAAFRINAEAVGAIGEAARSIAAFVVHYSTDFVFDGSGDGPHRETDATRPLSVYGDSKRAGEIALQQSGALHMILRTSWVYADRGKNFPLAILNLAKSRKSLDVVSDEIGAATSSLLIADATIAALRQVMSNRGLGGLYHLAAAGAASRCDLAKFIVAEARAAGAGLALHPDAIRPILARDYAARAERPLNSRLDITRFQTTFGYFFPTWQEGIRQLIKTLKDEGRL